MTRITPYSLVRGTLATVILAVVVALLTAFSPFFLAAGVLVLIVWCVSCDTWSDYNKALLNIVSGTWDDIKDWLRSYRGCWTEDR